MSPSCVPCFSTEETACAKGPSYVGTTIDKQWRGSGSGGTVDNQFPLG